MQHSRVLAVDLDHTFVETDTLYEQIARLLLQRPLLVPRLIRAAAKGKASLKRFCAENVDLNIEGMISQEFRSYLEEEKQNGAYLVLSTAAHQQTARRVVDGLDLFDQIVATTDDRNLKGKAKADELVRLFPQGFVYAGDHASDLAVWERSSGIVLVNTSDAVGRRARALGKPIIAEFSAPKGRPNALHVWARALRVHHWSKNVVMFIPLLLAHQWSNVSLLLQTCIGFILLLMATSSTYLINDLADLDADRAHATKRHRPLASGTLPILHALMFAAVVLPVVLVAAWFLSFNFAAALAAYVVLTLGYSFGFKRVPLLDTFLIGVLFTVRLLMGATMIQTTLPVWLVTFSLFFFFSLATAKRHAEVIRARTRGGASLESRGYEVDDWPLTLILGVSTGIASLVILVLYMVDEAFRVVGYTRPEFLWFVSVLVSIWVGRIWLLTHRGKMHDDPVTFALRDRSSQVIAFLAAVCFAIAL